MSKCSYVNDPLFDNQETNYSNHDIKHTEGTV